MISQKYLQEVFDYKNGALWWKYDPFDDLESALEAYERAQRKLIGDWRRAQDRTIVS